MFEDTRIKKRIDVGNSLNFFVNIIKNKLNAQSILSLD